MTNNTKMNVASTEGMAVTPMQYAVKGRRHDATHPENCHTRLATTDTQEAANQLVIAAVGSGDWTQVHVVPEETNQ